jgi:hypothetical protein
MAFNALCVALYVGGTLLFDRDSYHNWAAVPWVVAVLNVFPGSYLFYLLRAPERAKVSAYRNGAVCAGQCELHYNWSGKPTIGSPSLFGNTWIEVEFLEDGERERTALFKCQISSAFSKEHDWSKPVTVLSVPGKFFEVAVLIDDKLHGMLPLNGPEPLERFRRRKSGR